MKMSRQLSQLEKARSSRHTRQPRCAWAGDTLVATRLDRLGRNLVDNVTTIAELDERDMNVRCLEPALNTSRPADIVVINVATSLAESERDLLILRTREGVAQGRLAGPKPRLTAEQKLQVKKLLSSGDIVASVARAFGVSRQTIYRARDGA